MIYGHKTINLWNSFLKPRVAFSPSHYFNHTNSCIRSMFLVKKLGLQILIDIWAYTVLMYVIMIKTTLNITYPVAHDVFNVLMNRNIKTMPTI